LTSSTYIIIVNVFIGEPGVNRHIRFFSSCRFKALEGSNGLPKDVVEPPKFITGRHVAGIFEKLGFDATCGQKVFGVLCEALTRAEGENALTEGFEEDCDEEGRSSCES